MSRKRRRKGPGTGPIWMLLVVGALGLGALGAYVRFTPADKVPDALHRERSQETLSSTKQGTSQPDRVSKRVMVPEVQGEKIRMVEESTRHEDPKLYVLNETLKSFSMPEEAKAKSVSVVGGVARVDFTQEVLKGMGSQEGSLFLEAIQRSLGQFNDVELIRFTVDGEPIETLDGHTEVIDGVPAIRPGAKPGETPAQP